MYKRVINLKTGFSHVSSGFRLTFIRTLAIYLADVSRYKKKKGGEKSKE